jgi:proteasome ATPase
MLNFLMSLGEGAASPEQKVALAQSIRQQGDAQSRELDRYLIEVSDRSVAGLREAQASLKKISEVVEKLTEPPLHPAVYLGPVPTAKGQRHLVAIGSSRRVVGVTEEVPVESLAKGDEVYLTHEQNVVMAKSPFGQSPCGEVGTLERRMEGGRLMLNVRGDEKFIVEAAESLANQELRPGDPIRWQRDSWMAYERLPQAEESEFLLEDVPTIGRDRVGGQDANLNSLLLMLTATLVAPEQALLYGIGDRLCILMVGSPGCGKTLMFKVVAAELQRLSGKKCRVAVVKPGEWEDPFVGVTQQRTRSTFEALRRAAQDGIVVLFLDEIEAVGRIRGGLANTHSDKFLAALLAELDGFVGLRNVAVVAATNRKDLIDPALLERLSDVEIAVGRPDMRGARSIFGIHLAESFPYNANGKSAAATRREMIETAVSRFYSPNAGNELCVLRFRDGKTRTITARELASGRCFEQICRSARRAAFRRSVNGGEQGLCAADMEEAVAEAMERLATTLTPRNAHAYLSDLPQDVDVVSVEPIVRRVSRPHRYVSVA